MGRDRDDSTGPPSSHASQAQLYAAAAVSTAAGNRPSATGVDTSPHPAGPVMHCTITMRSVAESRHSSCSACSLGAASLHACAPLARTPCPGCLIDASPMPACPQ